MSREKEVEEKKYVWEPKNFVKGTFQNIENPGQELNFGYNSMELTLLDGGEYIIPEEVAIHLNGTCKTPIRKFFRQSDQEDAPSVIRTVGYKQRFHFLVSGPAEKPSPEKLREEARLREERIEKPKIMALA